MGDLERKVGREPVMTRLELGVFMMAVSCLIFALFDL